MVGDRVVLYHRVSRTAVVLNPTGRWVWSRLEAPADAGQLALELRERHPSLTEAQARRDIETFLDELRRHSLITADL